MGKGNSGYIPELDGLRAIAVLEVMLVHQGILFVPIPWGFNLFFVLSGFLITGILIDARNSPYYFRNFYIRRALRIFPIYYLTLGVLIVAGLALQWNLGDAIHYVIYAQNYVLGWKSMNADFPLLFTHSWSLAVEVQFYLVWPFIILAFSGRRLVAFLILLFLSAPLSRFLMYYTVGQSFLLYTSLPAQADSLAVGGLLAIMVRSERARGSVARKAVLVAAAAMAAIALLLFLAGPNPYGDPAALFFLGPGNVLILSLLSLLLGSVLILSISRETPLSSLLRNRWLRGIGKISYGLYLYHLPIFFSVFSIAIPVYRIFPGANLNWVRLILITLGFGLSFVCAILSWHFIESPISTLKNQFGWSPQRETLLPAR